MEGTSVGNLTKWTVVELRKYLQNRGVSTTGYSKRQLVDMVRQAKDSPQILGEVQGKDNEEINTRRRTVLISGKQEVFPHPETLSDWHQDLDSIPHVTNAHCLMYLMLKQNWPSNRVQVYEKERGYQLFFGQSHTKCNGETYAAQYCVYLCKMHQTDQPEREPLLCVVVGSIKW